MNSTDFLKKILKWLWPSLFVMVLSCVRKSVLSSLPFGQIEEGLLLYAGYLLFIIPTGILLSKLKMFDDESKLALILVCGTYIFFEYSAIFATWEQFAKQWVIQHLNNAQHTVFIWTVVFCGTVLMWVLGLMNQKAKNLKILLFTTSVLSVFPFIDVLRAPDYKFDSDLFNIHQSNSNVDQTVIPKRIFWIILDEHPSSLVLDEVWGYKDTTFRSGLESLGFTIYDSCVSNYNYSPYSIASTTYGIMLPIMGQQNPDVQQWLVLGDRIRQSPVMTFFQTRGYETQNLSFLGADFKKIFIADQGEIVKYRGEIVTSSVVGAALSQFDNQQTVSLGFYNWEIVDELLSLMNPIPKSDKPIFVYAHLIMPHGPFFPLEKKSTQWKGQYFEYEDDQAFLSHVKYTDSTILDLFHRGLDGLSPEQRSNTLVILQADHGPRYLQKGGKDLRLRSSFGILNAVLWPNNLRGKFYNGMSSVNTFRILFRDIWGINLSTIRDSSVNVCPIIKTEN